MSGFCHARRVSNVAAAERAALLDLFDALGPGADTLCQGWSTHDLAAHLVARERRPQAVAGIVVRPLHGLTEAAERRMRALPYDELLRLLRSGPPLWSAGGALRGPLSGVTDVHEFYVHHEDVRRLVDPSPRAADTELDAALWKRVRLLGGKLTSKVGVGVSVATPDGRTAQLRRGDDGVLVTGTPAELLLWFFGRRSAAHVELTGSPATRQVALTAPLGI